MTRVALVGLGLALWLIAGLGLRVYFGGRAYLAQLLGPDAPADAMFSTLLATPHATVLGMNPWAMLVTVGVLAAAALMLLLGPVEWAMRRRMGPVPRVFVLTGVAAMATAVTLKSVHPILSRRSVPEGPRTALNYACEAAGYGWVNALAYGGAVLAAAALVWLVVRREARAGASVATAGVPEVDPAEDAPAEDAPADASDAEAAPADASDASASTPPGT